LIKYILSAFIVLLMPLQAYAADTKGSALTRITTASSDDLVYVVDDPDGTPASRAITKENFLSGYVLESALATTLSDYVLSSALTTTLSDYVLASSLTTTLGDYVTSSSLTTTLGDYVLTSSLSTATVQTAGELSPTKESGVPGYSYQFEADTTSELTSGFQGSDDQAVNISYKFPNAVGTNGQVLKGGTPLTSQTLPDGRTGTVVPLSWGDMTGGGAPIFQNTDPDVTDASGLYQNRTDGDLFLVEQNVAISTVAMSRTPWWLLTVSDPGDSNVIASDGTIDCGDGASDCTQYLANTSTPQLTATAASGYEFLAWTGDATDTSTTTNPDTITMDAAKTVGATFNLLPTFVSAEMTTTTNVDLTLAENITIGSGGSGGIVVTGSVTGASNGTYASGDTTSTLSFTTADAFQAGETITIAYTQPTDGLEDSDGGDLASFSGESVTNSISGGSSYLVEWAADDLTLDTYDMDDGNTVAPASVATPSYSFVTGVDGNGIQLDTGTWAWITATDGNNIDWSHIHISFDVRYVSGDFDPGSYVITTPYEAVHPFAFRFSSSTQVLVTYNGASYYQTVTEDLSDGNFHHIDLEIVCADQTIDLYIGESHYTDSLNNTTVATPATQRLHLNGFNEASANQTLVFDNFKIQ
jgi:hypothetical protein